MQARIYRPVKSAAQSGRGNRDYWLVELCLLTPRAPESLMGWAGAGDTLTELKNRLRFPSKEQAVAFAVKQGWRYEVEEPSPRKIRPRNYLDNFRHIRPQDEERQAAETGT